MSDSLGARLRQERERRHIPLRSIVESTKIGFPLLEGLERDDLSRWPSGIFRKSFVRSYATAIGLDPDPIILEFQTRYPDPLKDVAAPEQMATLSEESPIPMPAVARQGELRPLVVKLTINSAASPFTRGGLLAGIRRRWAAAACDAGASCAIALALFPVLGHFWTSFAVAMLCYYFGGILILGNTPGVCLFAPQRSQPAGTGAAGGSERGSSLRLRA